MSGETAGERVGSTSPGERFDVSALLRRCLNDAVLIKKILNKFEAESVEDLEKLKQEIAAGNAQGTARVAHMLKGAASMVSAVGLSQIAATIEGFAHAGELLRAGQCLEPLQTETSQCLAQLPSVLERITGAENTPR